MAGTAVSRGVPRQILQGRQPTVAPIDAGAVPRIQFSSGSARALEQFSRDMFSLSNQFQDQLDEQVSAEGAVEGALAGAAGEPTLQDYGTIRGRAYNRAAVDTFVTTMETNAIFKVQELTAKFGADPAKLQQELDAWSAGAAGEVEKLHAPAGAAFRQRLALRSAPAVEAAKDMRYKLTRAAADAALIENEVALKAEITSLAGDLFSDNPERSEAAARAVGALQREYLQIFEAVDPTTNRPLYSAEEKAKAKVAFYEDVMKEASLGWFDQQPDKAGAYLKFTEGEFTINLSTPGADTARVIEAQGQVAAKRTQPLQPTLKKQLAAAAAATGSGVTVKVTSGGQPTVAESRLTGQPRTGSHRHDHGGAGDLVLMVDGKVVRPSEDRALYLKFAENAAAAGATGIGIDNDWIHVGGGTRSAWGYGARGGKSDYLPSDFEAAINRGWSGPRLSLEPQKQTVDLRKALPEKAMHAIESEMRARITFSNTLRDREEAAAAKAVKAEQDANSFELTNRIFGTGNDPETGQPLQPLTREELTQAVRLGKISATDGEKLVRALATEKPDRSDEATLRDAQARLYAGENIYNFVLENADKLSPKDSAELLGKNQTLNVGGAGSMSPELSFHFEQIRARLTPDSNMAKYDEGKQNRRFMALDEFRRRAVEGDEDPRVVSEEVVERATLDLNTYDETKLGGMIRPRFSVKLPDQHRIDIPASSRALFANKDKMTPAEFERQKAALKAWDDVQKSLDQTAPKGKKK